MFSELNKYKNQGHFFFVKGNNLKELSAGVPDLPGVYYIIRLSRGKIDLVYIGKSGTIKQNGTFKEQGLKERLNNKQDGMHREVFFNEKCIQENIDALDVYWFVTFDNKNHDLPGFVEGVILQRYFEVHGKLPPWNKEY
jgi:hypothetical protein